MNLTRAITTVGGLTGLSRIFGFIRDILTAAILGAGPIADAFFVALKLPNFFRRVTAEGAFSVAFVPVYTELLEKDGRPRADSFASNAFMVMLSGLTLFCALAMLTMPGVIQLVAPGFTDDPQRFALAVELSRITFPYLLAMSLVALLGGVLNAHNRFGPFAFAPVLFNLCLIGALLLAEHFTTPGHALSWGIAAAGLVQFLWLFINTYKGGFRLQIKLPRLSPNIKKTLTLMGPGVIGAGVMHVNLFADLILASFLDTGAISYLYYADRLNQLPLGIVGIAIGTALLPMLSKAITADHNRKAEDLFNRALKFGLILSLPAAVGLAALAPQIIHVLFERGAFTQADTAITAHVLIYYVIGMPAYISAKTFSTLHWARQDTVTPVKIAITATLANIAMSLALIPFIGVGGIALATGLSGWLQVILHLTKLKNVQLSKALPKTLSSLAGGCALMAAGVYAYITWMPLPPIPQLISAIILGGVIYGLSLLALRVITLADIQKGFQP